jgi:hypothetical protein
MGYGWRFEAICGSLLREREGGEGVWGFVRIGTEVQTRCSFTPKRGFFRVLNAARCFLIAKIHPELYKLN